MKINKKLFIISLSIFLLVLFISFSHATITKTYQQGVNGYTGCKTAYINSSNPNAHYGNDTDVVVGKTSGFNGDTLSSLIWFNLSSLNPNINLVEAKLNLTLINKIEDYPLDLYLYRLKREWDSGLSADPPTTDSGFVTWDYPKYNSVSWTEGGADDITNDRAATETDYKTIGYNTPVTYEFDVTNDVKAWVNGSIDNYGWILRINDYKMSFPSNDNIKIFGGVNNPTISYRPLLEIVYSTLIVNLNSPPDNNISYTGNFTLNCSAESIVNNELSNITLYHNFNGIWYANNTVDVTGSSNSTSWTFNNIGEGNYTWNCFVQDNETNSVWGENHTLIVRKNPPEIIIHSPENNSINNYNNQLINFSIIEKSLLSSNVNVSVYASNDGTNFGLIYQTLNKNLNYTDSFNWDTPPLYATSSSSLWTFDNDLRDSSSYHNDGLINGSVIHHSDYGKFVGSYEFDGNESSFIYIENPKGNLNITNAVTLEAWVNLQELPDIRAYPVIKGDFSHDFPFDSNYHLFITKEGYLGFGFADSGIEHNYTEKTEKIIPGYWYYIAGTYNKNTIRLYINGKLVGKKAETNSLPLNNHNFTIGKNLNGYLDEVRVTPSARSASEIANNYKLTDGETYYIKITAIDNNYADSNSNLSQFTVQEPFLITTNITGISYNALKNSSFKVNVTVSALHRNYTNLTLKPVEPYGYGVTCPIKEVLIPSLNESQNFSYVFTLNATRSNEVNLNQFWVFGFNISNTTYSNQKDFLVNVTDPSEGKIYYLLTEDLEYKSPDLSGDYDDGDNYVEWNEIQIPMINKSKKIEEIAEIYNASWNHMLCVNCVYVAEEGEKKGSSNWTGLYERLLNRITDSVAHGNQINPHIHMDKGATDFSLYGKYTWNNSYDAFFFNETGTDSFAHVLGNVGGYNYSEFNTSRTAVLYDHIKLIEKYGRLANPSFRTFFFRSGGYDVGITSTDEYKTIQAFKKVKILADTDDPCNGATDARAGRAYGENEYFTKTNDLNSNTNSLNSIGVLEMSMTPSPQKIGYDRENTVSLNTKVNKGWTYFSSNEIVNSGVHFIVGFTHTIYMSGDAGWNDLTGGNFSKLQEHLNNISQTYPKIIIGKSTDAVLDYYDYYYPEPLAIRWTEYDILTNSKYNQTSRYDIRILGHDIPVDANHTFNLSVKYPAYFENHVRKVKLYKDNILQNTYNMTSNDYYPDINFTFNSWRGNWTMEVNQTNYEFPYISSNFSEQGKYLKLNISSPYTFLKINLILNKSELSKYYPDINLSKIQNITLTLQNGTFYNLTNYEIVGNELRLYNATIQEANHSNVLKINFQQESENNNENNQEEDNEENTGGGNGIIEVEQNKEIIRNLRKGSIIMFYVKSGKEKNESKEKHFITITNIKNNSVEFLIRSTLIKTELKIKEIKYFDLNNDGIYDLSIVLKKIEDNKADLEINLLAEGKEKQENFNKSTTSSEKKKIPPNPPEPTKDYTKLFLTLTIIAITLIIIILIINKKKNKVRRKKH